MFVPRTHANRPVFATNRLAARSLSNYPIPAISPRWRGGPTDCHAEDRGFESLHPLLESPAPAGLFVPRERHRRPADSARCARLLVSEARHGWLSVKVTSMDSRR